MKKLQYFIITKSIGLYINFLSFFAPLKAQHLAYSIFSQPRKGRINPTESPKVLANAVQETLEYQHHKFQSYIWKGNNDVILLVHGWESNASRWKKTLPYLKKTGKTIIAIDAPAHGLSTGKEFNVPLYTEFLEIAINKYKPHILIGHSIGGAACVYHQVKYPNTIIKKLILLGAPSDLKNILLNYTKMLSLNTKVKTLLEKKFEIKFNINVNDFSGAAFAQNIPLKTLVAHDVNDKIVAFEDGKKYANSFKNGTFIKTTTLGHSLHNDQLYTKIVAFIQEA